MREFTSPDFWETCEEYRFLSIWPGIDDFLTIFKDVKGIQPADKVLHVGCGPGDLIIAIAQLLKDGKVYGIDFAQQSLNLTKEKLNIPHLLPQIMFWGRTLAKWYRKELNDRQIEKYLRFIGKGNIEIGKLKKILEEFIQRLRQYYISCSYDFLASQLENLNLIDKTSPKFYQRLFKNINTLGDDVVYEKIKNIDSIIMKSQNRIELIKMDAFSLTFPENSFDKVIAREIEPLLKKRGNHWIREMTRVCKEDGLILYSGLKYPSVNAKSDEMRAVKIELENNRMSIVSEGWKRLTSWWDPLFNDPDLNDIVFTPYLIARKEVKEYVGETKRDIT